MEAEAVGVQATVGAEPPARLELVVRTYRDPQVQELVAAVQAEYVARYGGPDEALVTDGEFDPPDGLFLLGLLEGVPVASGGWRRLEIDLGEIKRMFVLERARRRGFARLILVELERTARESGIGRLILNTGIHQPEAIALYESSGYAPAPGYGFYAGYPNARFYAKDL